MVTNSDNDCSTVLFWYSCPLLTSQMKAVNGVEAGSIQFKTETLVCQLLVQSSPTYSLVLKLQSPPDQSEHWTQEELQVRKVKIH